MSPEQYRVFGHGCLLDIIADALAVTHDFFFPTRIKCQARNFQLDKSVPLAPYIIREALDHAWSILSCDEDYEPACDIHGFAYLYRENAEGVTRALVPDALALRMEGKPGRRPVARLIVRTHCDAWLPCTLDGYDNAIPGSANGSMLTNQLIALETELDGQIIEAYTDFDEISIGTYHVKNK